MRLLWLLAVGFAAIAVLSKAQEETMMKDVYVINQNPGKRDVVHKAARDQDQVDAPLLMANACNLEADKMVGGSRECDRERALELIVRGEVVPCERCAKDLIPSRPDGGLS